MVFGYNKSVINQQFFRSEAQDQADGEGGSVEKKGSSPHQMMEVFMTPQSEDDDESYEESFSPDEVNLSPPAGEAEEEKATSDEDKCKQDSPPVSTFIADDDTVE